MQNKIPIEIDRDPDAFEMVMMHLWGYYDLNKEWEDEPIKSEKYREELKHWGLLPSDDPAFEQCFALMSIKED